jgi:hypothetical protein
MTWRWLTSPPDLQVRAVNGIHHFYSPGQDRDERRFSPQVALRTDYGYVYKLERGQPKLVARMQSLSRGYSGLVRAFVQEHLLMVDFADPERHVGDCCAEGYIRVHYRLQEGLFIEDGARERGDLASRDGLPRPRFSDYPVNRICHGEPVRPSSQRSSGHFGL